MKNFKSHFSYNKRQRNGVFFLLLLIIVLQFVFFNVDFSSNESIAITDSQILAFQNEMDSLRAVEIENRKPKIYPFNPNYITDFKGHQLGMSTLEIDRLHAFRKKNNFANSAKKFQEITKINDSLLTAISPFFKFPEWVVSNKTNAKTGKENNVQKPIVKKDINLITTADLIAIDGVGEKLAKRIVNYRTLLQGFSLNDQLYEVWYLDELVADRILEHYVVMILPKIQKFNVNQATFKQVLSIVYIDYELTKKIFNYRDEVAEIQSIEELKKIDGFPLDKFNRIALYLLAE